MMGPNIEVAVSVDAEAGQVEADRALLEQSLVSLPLNARDAMPEGGRLLSQASTSLWTATTPPTTMRPGSSTGPMPELR